MRSAAVHMRINAHTCPCSLSREEGWALHDSPAADLCSSASRAATVTSPLRAVAALAHSGARDLQCPHLDTTIADGRCSQSRGSWCAMPQFGPVPRGIELHQGHSVSLPATLQTSAGSVRNPWLWCSCEGVLSVSLQTSMACLRDASDAGVSCLTGLALSYSAAT